MTEHRAIWLEPGCVAESGEDRHWAQDDAWGKCDECERKSVKYIIATEHEAMAARVKYLEATEANKIASLQRRVACLEMIIQEELDEFDCCDEMNRSIVEEIHARGASVSQPDAPVGASVK